MYAAFREIPNGGRPFDGLGVVAPLAIQIAAFKKNRRPYAGPILCTETLNLYNFPNQQQSTPIKRR